MAADTEIDADVLVEIKRHGYGRKLDDSRPAGLLPYLPYSEGQVAAALARLSARGVIVSWFGHWSGETYWQTRKQVNRWKRGERDTGRRRRAAA